MSNYSALITGASGFIGQQLSSDLLALGNHTRLLVRDPERLPSVLRNHPLSEVVVGDLRHSEPLSALVNGVDRIFHLAGRAHIFDKDVAYAEAEYRAVNVLASQRLAEAAGANGVRRLVYVSSIKVNGEETHATPFRADDTPAPEDAYGRSKLAAEQTLFDVSQATGMELCVVRPPLVYGPGVRANFARLMNMVKSGWPIPFGAIDNRRSLVGVRNLTDLLRRCGEHPNAAGQVFLAGDGESLSTAELIRRIAAAQSRKPKLWNIPPALLGAALTLLGKGPEWRRLSGNLEVDIHHTLERLDWQPPFSMQAELQAMQHA
ncbi:MAG: NAD-dependent epimerase/dehydratase family protein [Gammaproteobacteria bacterium]|nr:NAD-dependent epimerase/dehydratase family protein [Gammaproteobacteria bacterium]MCP5137082.1 NAD-dependent epimerase/dehydratase family protein [Gammaproteobacteria bacterium]